MVVTVTVWLGWSYCTDSVVLIMASSRSSSPSSAGVGRRTKAISKQKCATVAAEFMCSSHRVLPVFPLASSRIPYDAESKDTHDDFIFTVKVTLCNLLTSHVPLLWLGFALPVFSFEFLPLLLSSFPPFACENQLNNPWNKKELLGSIQNKLSDQSSNLKYKLFVCLHWR